MPRARQGTRGRAAAVIIAAALAAAGACASPRARIGTTAATGVMAPGPPRPVTAAAAAGSAGPIAAHGVAAGSAGTIATHSATAGSVGPIAAHAAAPVAPQRLSETGLYLADGSVDPRNRAFSPQYPLWTDGATKSRWIRLPEGQAIDVSDIDAWRFPPGTTFWKEFAWHGRKVETRMIRRTDAGEWVFAAYMWNESQTEAFLAPEAGVQAAFEIAPGKRHSIPGVADCATCHGSAPAVALGFTALQLSDDRDPLAPHSEPLRPGDLTLGDLVDQDRLAPPRPDLVAYPPRIRSGDPVERAALGYLSANCGGCHNARGPLARLEFSLLHEVAGEGRIPEPGYATTAGARGRFLVPLAPADSSYLVAPGAPGRSTLLYRMASRRAAAQMPPLGTVIADTVAVDLIRTWIEGLRTQVRAASAG